MPHNFLLCFTLMLVFSFFSFPMKRFLLPLILSACGFIFLGAQPAKAYRICNSTDSAIQFVLRRTNYYYNNRSDFRYLKRYGDSDDKYVITTRFLEKGKCIESGAFANENIVSGASIHVFGHPVSNSGNRSGCMILNFRSHLKGVLGGSIYRGFSLIGNHGGEYTGFVSYGDGPHEVYDFEDLSCSEVGGSYYSLYGLKDSHLAARGADYDHSGPLMALLTSTNHYIRGCALNITPKEFLNDCTEWDFWFEEKPDSNYN